MRGLSTSCHLMATNLGVRAALRSYSKHTHTHTHSCCDAAFYLAVASEASFSLMRWRNRPLKPLRSLQALWKSREVSGDPGWGGFYTGNSLGPGSAAVLLQVSWHSSAGAERDDTEQRRILGLSETHTELNGDFQQGAERTHPRKLRKLWFAWLVQQFGVFFPKA